MTASHDAAESFIAKWQGVKASELSTSQSFLIDLCKLLGVESPHATDEQDYMFERPITFKHGDGSSSPGRIDLYRRGAFVLESKKIKSAKQTRAFDEAMLRARSQAEEYARALPASEGRPPFVVVVDVGQRIELYAEFSRSGGTYTPFPDPRSHRIALGDLRRPELLDRLRTIWTDPLTLDPSRESARVTREIAARLAELAKSLERAGHAPEAVAQFLMRCLFTMFAEDVRLLPADSFRDLLARYAGQPDVAMRMLAQLWRDMDSGGFSAVLASDVLRFNGKLFKHPDTLPLDAEQVGLLLQAAKADWQHVEPAIFGTLLERALDPGERHKLGAHYTPRAYVERLVLPTVIEPLREEWSIVKAAALVKIGEAEESRTRGLESEGRKSQAERLKQYNVELTQARDILLDFHKRLCSVRVLDPACGSGNFLYVTLEHLKRLEGEVLNALEEFGLTRLGVSEQTGIDVDSERVIAVEAQTVDPHNLLGIEINPRAAAIAEVVLWIGYLQWHFRTRGNVSPPTPVIRDFCNIECRDAVLSYDRIEFVTDEAGRPITRWDGKTMKPSPVTGESIPDDSSRIPMERYVNPRRAEWPAADFVVGNPPFIGNKRMRNALGDGYVEALRGVWTDVPGSADFVMYWWRHAALSTRRGALRRFGLITTNSITQSFNRRIVEAALLPTPIGRGGEGESSSSRKKEDKSRLTSGAAGHPLPQGEGKEQALSLVFAIPDHPWVDTADGAAVRIAMTVAQSGSKNGRQESLVHEHQKPSGEYEILTRVKLGRIHSDLSAGADVAGAVRLLANRNLSGQGIKIVGDGFYLGEHEEFLEVNPVTQMPVERLIVGPKNVLGGGSGRRVVDFFGLSEHQAKLVSTAAYQKLLVEVKPVRDQNARQSIRENWWKFAWDRPVIRNGLKGLVRYIATLETTKHRAFTFLNASALWDGSLFGIALEDARCLGVLSSVMHVTWALSAGSDLGPTPRYNNTLCFEPFPFPDWSFADRFGSRVDGLGEYPSDAVRRLGEQLDAHRKRQQAAHPELTLTDMYNVLEKLRSGEALSVKERAIHEQGLVSVLRQIHDELDAAVLNAYGWSDLLPLLQVAHGIFLPHAAAFDGTQADAKRAFEEAILERLVALNAERAAEEAKGIVRWLRPEYQDPEKHRKPEQARFESTAPDTESDDSEAAATIAASKPQPWPKDAVEQVRAVADLLAASPIALDVDEIAARFTGRGSWKKRLPQLLDMLVALGRAKEQEGRFAAGRF